MEAKIRQANDTTTMLSGTIDVLENDLQRRFWRGFKVGAVTGAVTVLVVRLLVLILVPIR